MTIPLKGGKDLEKFLSAFPANLQKGAVRAGLVAAAKPVRDHARANAPKETGKYAKSIKTGSPKVNSDGTVSIKVRTDPKGNNHAFLGLFFEYGVAAHIIEAGDSGISPRLLTRQVNRDGAQERDGALVIGNNFISGAVLHPGFAAKPHFRPALDTQRETAINAFGERIKSYLAGKTGFTGPDFGVAE